jgi:hypothetical protein
VAEHSPERQVSAFLTEFTPEVARVARRARAKLRTLLPGMLELVYDNYNALAIGFGPTERASDAIMSIAVYPRWVSVFFLRGAQLADPQKLLRGSGRRVRHIVLEGPETLDRPGVKALIKAAAASLRGPSGKGVRRRTIIKSVSAKRRPRRPPGATSAPRRETKG